MFTWFYDMKLGTRLLVVFMGLVVLVGGTVGVLGYYNVTSLRDIIQEITDQRVPSVKYATAVERYALRTLMDEKQYLLAERQPDDAKGKIQQSAMANIDSVSKALDEVDRVANMYGDSDLLGKSQEMRKVTEEYKQLYTQAVARIQENRKAEAVLKEAGDLMVGLSQSFFQSKAMESGDQAKQAMIAVVDLWETAVQTRLLSKEYMLTQDPTVWSEIELRLERLDTQFNFLKVLSAGESDLRRIEAADEAAKQYLGAARAWMENDQALKGTILPKMNEIGQKVQENAIKAEDAGWLAAEASDKRADSLVSRATSTSLLALALALLIGVALGVAIPRGITGPVRKVAAATEGLSVGDVDQRVDVRSRDEVGQMANSVRRTAVSEETSAAAEEVSASTEEMSAQVEEVVALSQSLSQMAEELQDAVSRFKLEGGHQGAEVAQRRRKDDWQQAKAQPRAAGSTGKAASPVA